MDVDGTITDGKIYMGIDGEIIKAFDIKDGYAIKIMLPKLDIIPIIITARKSDILTNRCKELGITEIHQGIMNKFEVLNLIVSDYSKRENCNYTLENVAYVGDDNLDIQCMKPIKQAKGITVCPSNAANDVLSISDFISIKNGGDGVVREFVEFLLTMRSSENSKFEEIKTFSQTAYDFIVDFNSITYPDGKYELKDGVYVNVLSYQTKDASLTTYETHEKYIDIQYILHGTEIILTEYLEQVEEFIIKDYDVDNDVTFYNYNQGEVNILNAGDFLILPPNVAHRGAIAVNKPVPLKKIVIKVPYNGTE